MAITPNKVVFEEAETLIYWIRIGLINGFTLEVQKTLETISDRLSKLLKEDKEQQNAG